MAGIQFSLNSKYCTRLLEELGHANSAAKDHFQSLMESELAQGCAVPRPQCGWELEAFLLGGWVSSLEVGLVLIAGTAQAKTDKPKMQQKEKSWCWKTTHQSSGYN